MERACPSGRFSRRSSNALNAEDAKASEKCRKDRVLSSGLAARHLPIPAIEFLRALRLSVPSVQCF